MPTCLNDQHDHTESDDSGTETSATATCADCGQPLHYDYAIEAHQHDAPDAPDCFLVTRDANATACHA